MKHFCSTCGKPTIYALSLPKFCCNCGNEFSLKTKQKDKSAHDQSIENLKNSYPHNKPEFVPVTKPEPKNYPNPARASFKILNDDEVAASEEDYDEYGEPVNINISKLSKIKPKFTIHTYKSASESFENMLTQSYASNYKPADLSDMRADNGEMPRRDANSILEEFKREAGANRNQQE